MFKNFLQKLSLKACESSYHVGDLDSEAESLTVFWVLIVQRNQRSQIPRCLPVWPRPHVEHPGAPPAPLHHLRRPQGQKFSNSNGHSYT